MLCPPFRARLFAPAFSRLSISLALLLGGALVHAADLPAWDVKTQGGFVTSLCRDMRGCLWIGTEDNGVWRLDPSAPKDTQYTHFTHENGLGDDDAYALACDQRGRIWVGTLNHGVSVFNGKDWKTYGPLNGPLGSRIFALTVNPKDGGVWMATEAGLARYQNDRWSYYTRAEGLPSDQASALAFSQNGILYVGTQCDGIAIGFPKNDYHTWRVVTGPRQMPNAPTGTGLPSSLINCLLVVRDGTVYAGTTTGLASSQDEGKTWHYRRGADWKDKLVGLADPVSPSNVPVQGVLLREDYVTCLAEDSYRGLWVGHRQAGLELLERGTDRRLLPNLTEENKDDFVTCLLVDGPGVWAGRYGSGLALRYGKDIFLSASSGESAVPPLPTAAAPPTAAQLTAILKHLQLLKGDLPIGGGMYLGEDWRTQGDWVGHYGRQYALLCAMQSPWGDHLPVGCPLYSVRADIGPHHASADALRSWIQWIRTDNSKSLYDPEIGCRRQAEHDDHGEGYSPNYDGPDIWYALTLPSGTHRVSLYFMNKDGQNSDGNCNRDYLVQIKPYRGEMTEADLLPDLAHARVRNFWGGVYKQFMLRGPSKYYIKIAKNNSKNTIVSAVMIDKMKGPISEEEDMQTVWLGKVRYDPPDFGPQPFTPTLTVARTLWGAMDSMYDQPLGLALETRCRVFAYRSIMQEQTSQELLANWRWNLNLWSTADRNGFKEAMTKARISLLSINPQLRALNN